MGGVGVPQGPVVGPTIGLVITPPSARQQPQLMESKGGCDGVGAIPRWMWCWRGGWP